MASRLRNKVDDTGLGEEVSEVVQALSIEPLDKTGLVALCMLCALTTTLLSGG